MKTLVKNVDKYGRYASEVVEQNIFGEDMIKFKIVAENGNSYSRLKIYILNANGLSEIANEYDVPEYEYIDYVVNEETRKDSCNSTLRQERIGLRKYLNKTYISWKQQSIYVSSSLETSAIS